VPISNNSETNSRMPRSGSIQANMNNFTNRKFSLDELEQDGLLILNKLQQKYFFTTIKYSKIKVAIK
jgi:hypothetical protein